MSDRIDYSAPRKFSSPPTAQELDRLAEDVANLYRAAVGVVSLRPRLGVWRDANKPVFLGYGEFVRIDTSSGQTVRALFPDVRRSGLVGVLRLSNAGAVTVLPAPGILVDGISTYSVPATVGGRLFYSDGGQWFTIS